MYHPNDWSMRFDRQSQSELALTWCEEAASGRRPRHRQN
jgi:hypothetical protein